MEHLVTALPLLLGERFILSKGMRPRLGFYVGLLFLLALTAIFQGPGASLESFENPASHAADHLGMGETRCK
jgi:hypothetical protein